MVTPARRREPRSGKRRVQGSKKALPIKGYKERKSRKTQPSFSSSSNVFSESDIFHYNQGGVQGKRTKEDNDENKDKSVDIVQDSSPLDDSMEVCRTLPMFYLLFTCSG